MVAAVPVAVGGATPWAVGVLIFEGPAGWESLLARWTLLLAAAVAAVAAAVFGASVRNAQTASILVRVRVAQGELTLAPHPIRDQKSPSEHPEWWRRTRDAYRRLASDRASPHERDLSRVLITYAGELAAQIDSLGSA
jgi:hypothetical protein